MVGHGANGLASATEFHRMRKAMENVAPRALTVLLAAALFVGAASPASADDLLSNFLTAYKANFNDPEWRRLADRSLIEAANGMFVLNEAVPIKALCVGTHGSFTPNFMLNMLLDDAARDESLLKLYTTQALFVGFRKRFPCT